MESVLARPSGAWISVEWRDAHADRCGAVPPGERDAAGSRSTPSQTQKPDMPGKAFVRLTAVSAKRWLAKVAQEKDATGRSLAPEGPQLDFPLSVHDIT